MTVQSLRTSILALAITVTLGTLTACGPMNDDGSGGGDGDGDGTSSATLTLESDALPALGDGYVWEGWLVVDGAPKTTGRFSVEDGKSSYSFDVSGPLAERAKDGGKFVLTIEPTEGDDPAPSKTKFLAGDLSGGSGTATIAGGPALGTDFSSAAGTFILAAPSSDDATYKNGIWFIKPMDGDKTPGLTLPELPDGWQYEGWVANSDGPMTTGRFSSPDGADSDAGGETAGSKGTPPFPGQDFVTGDGKIDLTSGYKAVISVEPQPDDSPKPFALKPLVGEITDAGAMSPQQMENKSGSAPSVSVTLE